MVLDSSVVFSGILVPIISTKEILEKNGGYPTLPPSTFCHLRRSLFSTQDVAVVGMARRGLYTQNNSKTGRRKKAAIIKKMLVFPVVSVCVKLLPF